MKSYTDIKQSKVLSKILPLESADMYWDYDVQKHEYYPMIMDDQFDNTCIRAWSLAALMKILHRNEEDIVSLSYGGYKDGEYILNWCLDYEFEDGDYKKTFSDNPVDACYEMIIKLHKLNLL